MHWSNPDIWACFWIVLYLAGILVLSTTLFYQFSIDLCPWQHYERCELDESSVLECQNHSVINLLEISNLLLRFPTSERTSFCSFVRCTKILCPYTECSDKVSSLLAISQKFIIIIKNIFCKSSHEKFIFKFLIQSLEGIKWTTRHGKIKNMPNFLTWTIDLFHFKLGNYFL